MHNTASPSMPSFWATHIALAPMTTSIVNKTPNQPPRLSPTQARHCREKKRDQNRHYDGYQSLRPECSQWPLHSKVSNQSQNLSGRALARLAFVVKYTARVHCCDDAPVVIPGIAASAPNSVLQISLCPTVIVTDNRIFDCD